MYIDNIVIDINELNTFLIIAIKIRSFFVNLIIESKRLDFSYVYNDFLNKRRLSVHVLSYNYKILINRSNLKSIYNDLG